jgi:DNA-binding response OmpR family regulator
LKQNNQILSSGNIDHKLTYREAKLLRLFVSNVNQLLERDSILKAVWEDEGIIVGRSLDVFVSRIRKILQDDTSVQIVTLHGVGYKLQVSEK